MLPISFLRQLISFYGDQMQMVVPSFLEQSMIAFAKEQERFREQMKSAIGKTPIDMMKIATPIKAIEEQARRNIEMFQNAMRLFTPFPPGSQHGGPAEAGSRGARETSRRSVRAEGTDRRDAAQDRFHGMSMTGSSQATPDNEAIRRDRPIVGSRPIAPRRFGACPRRSSATIHLAAAPQYGDSHMTALTLAKANADHHRRACQGSRTQAQAARRRGPRCRRPSGRLPAPGRRFFPAARDGVGQGLWRAGARHGLAQARCLRTRAAASHGRCRRTSRAAGSCRCRAAC